MVRGTQQMGLEWANKNLEKPEGALPPLEPYESEFAKEGYEKLWVWSVCHCELLIVSKKERETIEISCLHLP
jgi:hypothetical protein